MHEITFRVVQPDGTYIHWEDPFVLPDGTEKPASIDDIPRETIQHLHTLNHLGEVLHTVSFAADDHLTKRAVWRCVRKITVGDSVPTTLGALSGYNELKENGTTELRLAFIDPDGTVSPPSGYDCTLHQRELFD